MPHAVGPFLRDVLSTSHMPIAAPVLEDLAIYMHEDSELDHLSQELWPASILNNAAAFPSLKSLILPGYHTFLPMPSSEFSSLVNLSVDGTGLENSSPLYWLFHLLHKTPNLTSLQYKTPDQFSYAAGIADGCTITSYSPGKFANHPVSLPIPLPHLREADVSTPGSGMDLLRSIIAPELETVHFDGTREMGYLERSDDPTLPRIMQDTIRELADRSPRLRRLVLTEVPLHEDGFSWILTGGTSGVEPFPHLQEFTVRDPQSINGALARFAARNKDEGITLKKLGIHRANALSAETILSAARRAVERLHQKGHGEFVMEFMENHGPNSDCVGELAEMGVKVIWVDESSGPNTERDGWWTRFSYS